MNNYPPYNSNNPCSQQLQPTMPSYRRQFYDLPSQPKPPKPSLFSKKQQLTINIAALIAVILFCSICIIYGIDNNTNTVTQQTTKPSTTIIKATMPATPSSNTSSTSNTIPVSKAMSASSPTTDPSPTSEAMPDTTNGVVPTSTSEPVSKGDVPPVQATPGPREATTATSEPRPTQVQTVPTATPTTVQAAPTPTAVPTVVPTHVATTEPTQQPTEVPTAAPTPIATSAPTQQATSAATP